MDEKWHRNHAMLKFEEVSNASPPNRLTRPVLKPTPCTSGDGAQERCSSEHRSSNVQGFWNSVSREQIGLFWFTAMS